MPRDLRLSLPHAPGIYRMLRIDGSVLYVGKAASLHHRVNSYFRKQNGVPERLLEMLSQARAISFDVTPSPLEAALLEPDEIKRRRPPYNVALTIHDRALWFTSPDLSARSPEPSPHCPLGPFASLETLDQFVALARGDRAALTSGPWGPGCRRPAAARREAFTVASFDRLRVLTTELKRLIAAGAPVALRLGVGRALDESRLASALWWV